MPALQVREFPEELYERLRLYAEANHRSIAQQTVVAVEQMLGSVEVSGGAGPRSAPFETSAVREARMRRKREIFSRAKERCRQLAEPSNASLGAIVAEAKSERDCRFDEVLAELSEEGR